MRRALARSLIVLGLMAAAFPSAAGAATINVAPGVGTLQAAINGANPGDTLKLAPGTYTGAVTVDRRLKIVAVGSKLSSWTIDGECAVPTTLTITADGVSILGKGLFEVTGATTTQMRVVDVPRFTLKQMFIRPHLPTGCGAEQNGLEVFGGSTKARLTHVVTQFNPAVGTMLDSLVGAVSFSSSGGGFDDNGIGLLITDSGGGSEPGKSGIKIKKGFFVQTSLSPLVRVVNSDAVQLAKNQLEPPDNGIGIELDAQSDLNELIGNKLVERGSPYVGVTLLSDAGSGNCGKNNDFTLMSCP